MSLRNQVIRLASRFPPASPERRELLGTLNPKTARVEASRTLWKNLEAKEFKVTPDEAVGLLHLGHAAQEFLQALAALDDRVLPSYLTPAERDVLGDARYIAQSLAVPQSMLRVEEKKRVFPGRPR